MNNRIDIIKKWFSMWLTKTDDGISEIFDSNVIYKESYGPTYKGLGEIESWFTEWNNENIVEKWDIEDFFDNGDKSAVSWTFTCKMNDKKASTFIGMSLIQWTKENKILYLTEYACKDHI